MHISNENLRKKSYFWVRVALLLYYSCSLCLSPSFSFWTSAFILLFTWISAVRVQFCKRQLIQDQFHPSNHSLQFSGTTLGLIFNKQIIHHGLILDKKCSWISSQVGWTETAWPGSVWAALFLQHGCLCQHGLWLYTAGGLVGRLKVLLQTGLENRSMKTL